MKMGRASIKINLGYSCVRENSEVNKDDKRLNRRWKRRLISNENLKRNRCAKATRITVTSCGNMAILTDNNGHMVEDEVDEDYKIFLDKYFSHIDVVSDNNVDGSDIDIDTDYNSENDPQYKTFLENLRGEGKSYVFEVVVDNQVVHIRYEGEEEQEVQEEEEQEEERLHDELNRYTSKMLKGFRWNDKTRNVGTTESDSRREQTGSPVEAQKNLETGKNGKSSFARQSVQVSDMEIEPCNARPGSELSGVPEHNCNSEVDSDGVDEDYQTFLNSRRIDGDSSFVRKSLQVSDMEIEPCNVSQASDVCCVPEHSCNCEVDSDSVDEDYQIFLNSCRIDGDSLVFEGSELKGKSSIVRQNSQVSDQAFDTPKVQCDIDEDYQLFLNSVGIDDDNLVHMRERNVTKIYKVEDGSNSSDLELILLEPNQFCENTPFISSKTYDSSWFENARNFRDSSSQFRKRLMEFLERPFDQEEHDVFMHEVCRQRQKERHRETRQGVVKLCCVDGVNKSYRELYPDLAQAIDQVKEPHKVLFLLRGFIYWLQNLSQVGTFRPWLDTSCLEILQKM